jgi:hypothetical protein
VSYLPGLPKLESHIDGGDRVVFRLTQEKIKHLPDLPPDVDEAAAQALIDAEQGAPLLRDFSPEPEDEDEIPTPHSKD